MMRFSAATIVLSIGIALALNLPSHGQTNGRPVYPINEAEAARIVQRVLKVSSVIDGHNDLLVHYFDCKTCPLDLTDYPLDKLANGHTDIPRMRKGGVGALLLNVFGGDLSPEGIFYAYDLVRRMEEAYPNDLKVVGSSSEMRAAMKNGRIALLPILETSVRLKGDPALLRSFYQLGLRSVTLAYKTNEMADGSDDEPKHNGLSDVGRMMVREMNRLGVLVDISHVSEKAMMDVLDLTQAPVIFSHSNARALTDVNRNVSDDVLKRLKTNGGIVMLTFVPYFTTNAHAKWLADGDKVYFEQQKLHNGDVEKMAPVMDKWEKDNPEPKVTIADMADHFDHVKSLIGAEHIGIAGDFDGISFTIKGLEDTSTYPALLTELARRGWTEAELRRITGENFLRVFETVEKRAAELRRTTSPAVVKTKPAK